MASALGDITIIDFSRVLAGPMATMVLADLGATVIKIERGGPGSIGDDTRAWGPPYDDRGESTYFQAVNRNKESLVLDLASEPDAQRARELCRTADVVIENFRPGVMERLGLDEPALRAENRGLVYCAITGFGQGAGAELPGYDLLVQALGGLMSITGEPDGPPEKVGVALVDVVCGLFASTGILAALRHRDATGEGQRVELDLLTSLLAALANQSAAYTVAGHVPKRLGNQHPSIAPYELISAADGDVVLAVGNDKQFGALCEQIGRPGLTTDPRFVSNDVRVSNRTALRSALEQAMASNTVAGWVDRLMAAGVPAGAVNDISAAFALADRLGLEPTVQLERDDGSIVSLPRSPIGLSLTPATYRSAPPTLGSS